MTDSTDVAKQTKEQEVSIILNETSTIFLFQQQSSIANFAGPEAESVQAENKTYTDYCAGVSSSENFTVHEVETFHDFTKDKEAQTMAIIQEEYGIQLDLHDLSEAVENEPLPQGPTPLSILRESSHPLASHQWTETRPTDLIDPNHKIDFGPNSEEADSQMHQMKNIGHILFVIERMVQQNIHIEKILNYTTAKADVDVPNSELLMKFYSDSTFARPVTSLSFNPQSLNFFACSYGSVSESMAQQYTGPKSTGMICIWNILNPGQPERIILTASIPTSVRFSKGIPYLLAVGFEDGAVGLYDIRKKNCDVIAMSTVDTGSHEGIVGQVVFQQRTDTRVKSEAVVSVGSDGRVTQWTVANGLEHKDLVTLKKLKVIQKDGESQTLRYEDLHCVSFNPSQPNVYIVGSEDGAIFICDTQYNEDFTQKLLFHFRTVMSVKFSPFAGEWFISGSCDGSAAIWNTQRTTPVSQFYLNKATFNDIEWSPISGTVFAAACSDGECRIWDFSLDTVDPVVKLSPYEKKDFTAIDWSPKLPVFVAGTTSGLVYLTKVVGLASLTAGRTHEEEHKRFMTVIQTMSNQA